MGRRDWGGTLGFFGIYATGVANPAARNLGNYRGIGDIIPFVNRIFEWGMVIATFLSVFSIVRCHSARLTYFFHPKLRAINAVRTITIASSRYPAARSKRLRWQPGRMPQITGDCPQIFDKYFHSAFGTLTINLHLLFRRMCACQGVTKGGAGAQAHAATAIGGVCFQGCCRL